MCWLHCLPFYTNANTQTVRSTIHLPSVMEHLKKTHCHQQAKVYLNSFETKYGTAIVD